MDIIEMTRSLAKEIQKDESFLRLEKAQKIVEENEELQGMIAEFNLQRYNLGQEVGKEEKNQDRIDELDSTVRGLYDAITGDLGMVALNEAQDEFDDMFNFVTHILQMAANGVDPDTVEKHEATGGCSGSCDSCGGCH